MGERKRRKKGGRKKGKEEDRSVKIEVSCEFNSTNKSL